MNDLDFSLNEDHPSSAGSLLDDYRDWRNENPTAPFQALVDHWIGLNISLSENVLVELCVSDLMGQLERGVEARVEDYLNLTDTSGSNDFLLDLIDAEICARSEKGDASSFAELSSRFQSVIEQLAPLLEVHQADLEAGKSIEQDAQRSRQIGDFRIDRVFSQSHPNDVRLADGREIQGDELVSIVTWPTPKNSEPESVLQALNRRKQLRPHPNLKRVLDTGFVQDACDSADAQKTLYVVLSPLSGKPLWDIVDDPWSDPFDERTVGRWIVQVANVVQTLESNLGVNFRITPNELFIDDGEGIQVLEFPLIGDQDQIDLSANVDPDSFALRNLGLLMFSLCLHESDISELESHLKSGYQPISLRDVNPSISKAMNDIFLSCVHPKKRRRYKNVKQLIDDLNRFVSQKTVKATKIQSRWF